MIFSNTSEYMLKYQKAKAKLTEYGVAEEDYPRFPLNSNELSYPTIYIISRYVESIIENNSSDREEFASLLTVTSQYFDAAVNSKDRIIYDTDFLLSGASAYFLSNDFGSAKVLCSKIGDNTVLKGESPQLLLKELFNYLLLNKRLQYISYTSVYSKIHNAIIRYFRTGENLDSISVMLTQYRKDVYNNDNPIEIYYVDILFAVILESTYRSSWRLIPEYSDLDLSLWKEYLQKSSAIKMLWQSQQLIGEKGILRGKNAIVQLPTGVGKTKSIELIIRSAFLSKRATTVIIVAPLRALCNEITTDMTRAFERDVLINQFSDVLQDDFSFDLSESFKSRIIICTPEKLSYIMHHQADILSDIDLYIFDEGHMFDDGSRGVTYELLVSEIRSKINEQQQVILLSAVLSNSDQIKGWLFGDSGVLAEDKNIKATPKSIGFSSQSKDIHYYSDDPNNEDYYIPKSIEIIELEKLNKERNLHYFPSLSDSRDIAIYYAIKLCVNGGVAIYVNQTRSVNTVIKKIIDLHKRRYDMTPVTESSDQKQLMKLFNLISAYYGEEYTFSIASKLGILPHYANLPNGIKLAVEYAFKHNHIRFVVCTSTLAQGVNIPIKYLFMTSFMVSKDSMQIRKFQNLMGRTARSGMYTEGSIVITDSKYFDNRFDRKHGGNYRWYECVNMFNSSAMEPCSSSILSVVKDIINDYESGISGNAVAKFIINNYSKRNCFEELSKQALDAFLKKYPEKKQNSIEINILLRKSIVESIENHLCFIYADDETLNKQETAISVCQGTLAYVLATDEEKQLLIDLFIAIASKIENYSTEQIRNFARTMIGIDLSCYIQEWLVQNDITNCYFSEEQLLDMILLLFKNTHTINKAADEFGSMCKLWISGKTLIDISIELAISIIDIEDVCSKTISYELSFFIGNIVDMLEIDEEEDTINPYFTLSLLQKKIKYGVSSETAVSICEKIFNDRYLANILSDIIEIDNVTSENIIENIKQNKDKIQETLLDYPDYFIERINYICED